MNDQDEAALIARCLAGEAAAFEPLVARYHGPLFHVAVRMLGDREDARDATQSAFLKAYQALPDWNGNHRFFSWIYRILVNDCLNVLRSRRPTEPLTDVAGATPGMDTVESAEMRRRVRHALLKLSPEHRDVIVLRHFAELPYDQIAAFLEIPEKMVKSRLFSARQRLCELLAGERV